MSTLLVGIENLKNLSIIGVWLRLEKDAPQYKSEA